MGLLGGLFNVANEFVGNTKNSSEKCASEIEELKSFPVIQQCVPMMEILEHAENYKGLGFGKESAAKPESIMDQFAIPSDEIVVVVLKGRIKVTNVMPIDKVVITDKALYINPDIVSININEKARGAITQRIDFSTIMGSLFFPMKDYESITMYNADFEIKILINVPGKSWISDNSAEKSLISVLELIRDKTYRSAIAMNTNSAYARIIERKHKWFSEDVCNKYFSAQYNSSTDSLIKQSFGDPTCKTLGYALYLFKPIATMDFDVIDERMNSLELNTGEDEEFLLHLNELIIGLVNVLSDHHSGKVNDTIYSWLKIRSPQTVDISLYDKFDLTRRVYEIINRYAYQIIFYTSIRGTTNNKIDELAKYAENHGIEIEKDDIIRFVFLCMNKKARKNWDLLKGADENKSYSSYGFMDECDPFGLRLAHYAVIQNTPLMEEVFIRSERLTVKDDILSAAENDFIQALDFGVAYAYRYEYEFTKYRGILHNDPQYQELKKKLDKLIKQQKIAEFAEDVVGTALNSADQRLRNASRSGRYDDEKLSEVRDTYNDLKSRSKDAFQEIDFTDQQIEVLKEMDELSHADYEKSKDTVEQLKNKNSFGSTFVFYFYANTQNIENAMSCGYEDIHWFDDFGTYYELPIDLLDLYGEFKKNNNLK